MSDDQFPIKFKMSEEFKMLTMTGMNICRFLISAQRYTLAHEALKLGVINKSRLDAFENDIKNAKNDEEFELTQDDILFLYTVLDLSIKSYLSNIGDDFKKITIKHKKVDEEKYDSVRNFYLQLAGKFIRGMRNDFQNVKAFREHQKKMDLLQIPN